MTDLQTHWSQVYTRKAPGDVSWYQPRPETSLNLIQQTSLPASSPFIDVGAGASTLVDHLIAAGYTDLTLLDIAAESLAVSRQRLGAAGAGLTWLVGDVTTVTLPTAHYQLWHDRAVFHFLTEPAQQQRYVQQMRQALAPGAHLIIATFAINGPQQCSGLDVMRYDVPSLMAVLGASFQLIASQPETHTTPWGSQQQFIYLHCRYLG